MKEIDNKHIKYSQSLKIFFEKELTQLQMSGKAGLEKMIKGTCNQSKE